jgi:hypothetical protein
MIFLLLLGVPPHSCQQEINTKKKQKKQTQQKQQKQQKTATVSVIIYGGCQ